MPNQLAIISAALIIGLSIVGTQFLTRYAIAPGTDTGGAPVVWRLNVRTGTVELCSFAESDNPFAKLNNSLSLSANVKAYDLTCRQTVLSATPKP